MKKENKMRDKQTQRPTTLIEYEFSSRQNTRFQALSKTMHRVGILLILIEVPWTLLWILFIINQSSIDWLELSVLLAQISAFSLITWWTLKAASAFKRIAITQGEDLKNLMKALGEIKNIYRFQRWIIIITISFLILKPFADLVFPQLKLIVNL
jgi:hypothetical protein